MPQPRKRHPELDTWVARARCATVSPQLVRCFHSDDRVDQRKAKLVCNGCPVRDECLDHALTHREDHGVWGGRTEAERRQIRRNRRRLQGLAA